MTSFVGKVIAVTGAASGIGRATAHLLASRGATLALADINQEQLDITVKDILKENDSAKIFSRTVNVAKANEVASWLDETVNRFGALNGAANLAGIEGRNMILKGIAELEDSDLDEVMDVNLRGIFNCVRAELQRIPKDGSIVNASSVAGLRGSGFAAPYCISKVSQPRFRPQKVGADNDRLACHYWLDTLLSARGRSEKYSSQRYRSVSQNIINIESFHQTVGEWVAYTFTHLAVQLRRQCWRELAGVYRNRPINRWF